MNKEIITREEAILMGLPRYYTGVPCRHGHDSERYTKNKECVECTSIRNKSNVSRQANKRWKQNNDEANKAYQRAYQRTLRQKKRLEQLQKLKDKTAQLKETQNVCDREEFK